MTTDNTSRRSPCRHVSEWAPVALLAIMLSLTLTGCGLNLPFSARAAREEALRQQVEKDSFPTAKQNGL